MSDALAFLGRLRHRGVRVWAEAGRLHYAAPAGVLDDELLGELAARRDDLLAVLARIADAHPGAIPRRREPGAPLPLSPNQRGLVLAQQLAPDEPLYSMPAMLWLRGRLEVAALRRGVRALGAGNEALRIRFMPVDGEPHQCLTDEPLDLAEIEAPGADAAVAAAVASSRRPFRLYG